MGRHSQAVGEEPANHTSHGTRPIAAAHGDAGPLDASSTSSAHTRGRHSSPLAELRGASRLAVDLTVVVTGIVETMHHNIARRPGVFGRATLDPTRGITGFVYRSVRGITRVVGRTIDAALRPLEPLLADASFGPERDAVISVLNGVLGDHLEATGNPLAILRYNSGRHISTNGAELSELLEQMVAAWPVPVHDLTLIGHSMGGLVIRSACAAAEGAGHRWLKCLRAMVFLGTPHHGAPLERGGHGLDMLFSASPYTVAFARLSQLRSAGITDLRHGSVLERDWHGRERFGRRSDLPHAQPLPGGIPVFAVAGSLSATAPRRGTRPRGDGLVPVASALGLSADPSLSLGIDPARQAIVYGVGHLDLLCSDGVYEQMKGWLSAPTRTSQAVTVRTRRRRG